MSGKRDPKQLVNWGPFQRDAETLRRLNALAGLRASLVPSRPMRVMERAGQSYESSANALPDGRGGGQIGWGVNSVGNTDTLAHELGHIAEAKYLPNRGSVDQYIDTAFGPGFRGLWWLKNSQQGRSELAASRPNIRRDAQGLPSEGPNGAHTGMTEQYANDFGASLGAQNQDYQNVPRTAASLRAGQVWSHASPDRMLRLRQAGLVARTPYSGWSGPQGPAGPNRTFASRGTAVGPAGPQGPFSYLDASANPQRQFGVSPSMLTALFGLRQDTGYRG